MLIRQSFDFEVYASAARTATPTAVTLADNMLNNAIAIHLILEATAAPVTPSVVTTVDYYDSFAAAWYPVFTSAAVTTVSTNVYKIGPGLTESANLIVADYIPNTNVRITCTHGDADSITYSVTAKVFK